MAETEAAVAAPEQAEASGVSRGAYLKAAVVVLVLVVLECAAAYFLIPSADDAAAMAQTAIENDPPELADPEPAEEEEAVTTVEADLGAFHVSSYQPATNTTLRIDLQLYAVVNQEDEEEFLGLLEKHRHRIRERVLVILRSAEISDLTDAGLGLIKRQILEKVNKILEKPLVQRIVISEFSFIEQ